MKTSRLVMDNEFESDMFTEILIEEKIPNNVFSYHSSAYDGLFQMSMGWGYIEVPEEYQKRAEELLQSLKNSKPE